MKKPDPKRPGNRGPHRGHWPAGKPRNPAPATTLKTLADAAAFFAAVRAAVAPSPSPSHLSLKCCARECGISHGSLRHYLTGRYVPAPESARAIRAWLRHAKSVAKSEGYI